MRKLVVGCLLKNEGKYLLLKRASGKTQSGKLGIPGGKVDEGETKKDALIREVVEETGYKLKEKQIRLVDKIEHAFDPADHVLFYTYFAEVEEQFKPLLSEHEHVDYSWLSLDEMHSSDETIDTLTIIIERSGIEQ